MNTLNKIFFVVKNLALMLVGILVISVLFFYLYTSTDSLMYRMVGGFLGLIFFSNLIASTLVRFIRYSPSNEN